MKVSKKENHHFKIMVEISAVNIVMRRNAVNFDIIFFINLDFFYKWCPVLFNVHTITINLKNNNKQDFIILSQ